MNGQLPYEGDTFIPIEIQKLKDKLGLKNFIETGTQYGATTKQLCEIFKDGVNFTIEADREYFDSAIQNCEGVAMIHDRSEIALKSLKPHENTLFYLDAHGCNIGGCPLKKELAIIRKYKLKNFSIIIHDFKVPNHPEFGYDAYDFELCYDEIKDFVKGLDYHYNSEANRGVIYLYPKV